MQRPRPFWYLLDIYGWVVLGMSVITAFIVHQWWVVLLGLIGYLISLLTGLAGGRALGRTGAMRLARAEQENRELKAEQARLLGAIRERDEKLGKVKKAPETVEPDSLTEDTP
jgi:hypothetical protein